MRPLGDRSARSGPGGSGRTQARTGVAGVAGEGFAVVASEVEDLAAAMSTVGSTVGEMNGLVDGIAAAVDGSASLGPDRTDVTGLSRMAERLRSPATGFLGEMRSRATHPPAGAGGWTGPRGRQVPSSAHAGVVQWQNISFPS
jgi:hypothetical protein